ncbi:hypothetical protein L2E82_40622 [Cichorium intybus]|uniref:Uncharacterized protein n=1 Tax=Cichorium intybus TaxID=13427 RepID=A0ACB9AM96_CICIN|nr:hypothetical protein L2E82_40622 [Cichorium intybus]
MGIYGCEHLLRNFKAEADTRGLLKKLTIVAVPFDVGLGLGLEVGGGLGWVRDVVGVGVGGGVGWAWVSGWGWGGVGLGLGVGGSSGWGVYTTIRIQGFHFLFSFKITRAHRFSSPPPSNFAPYCPSLVSY